MNDSSLVKVKSWLEISSNPTYHHYLTREDIYINKSTIQEIKGLHLHPVFIISYTTNISSVRVCDYRIKYLPWLAAFSKDKHLKWGSEANPRSAYDGS